MIEMVNSKSIFNEILSLNLPLFSAVVIEVENDVDVTVE